VEFVEAGNLDDGPITKLCGRPAWLEKPQWPVSRELGRPMFFLGQFRLDDGPAGEPRLAYLFMTDSVRLEIMDEDADPPLDHDIPDVHTTFDPEGGENAVIIQPGGRVPAVITVEPVDEQQMCWREESYLPVDKPVTGGREPIQFLGGEPVWLQSDQSPGQGWTLIAQLDEQLGFNFGDAGVGYVFLSPDGMEGRFLWQCH
jgi:hypothetical protein